MAPIQHRGRKAETILLRMAGAWTDLIPQIAVSGHNLKEACISTRAVTSKNDEGRLVVAADSAEATLFRIEK